MPLAYFAAPIPPTPFPSGEGGDYKLILPGASPPAPLRLCLCGTGGGQGGGNTQRWLDRVVAGLPYLYCSLCPYPPDPRSQSALPGGKGETIPPSQRDGGDNKLFLPGASPAPPLRLCLCGAGGWWEAVTPRREACPGRRGCGGWWWNARRGLDRAVTVLPRLYHPSCPIPPTPFPVGRGRL